jgi:hypothetical protein
MKLYRGDYQSISAKYLKYPIAKIVSIHHHVIDLSGIFISFRVIITNPEFWQSQDVGVRGSNFDPNLWQESHES